MTQQKSKNQPKKVQKNSDLRDMFMKMDKNTQDAVINYFNLHNAAIWIYANLSEDAQKYITFCIKMSQKADKIEEQNKE